MKFFLRANPQTPTHIIHICYVFYFHFSHSTANVGRPTAPPLLLMFSSRYALSKHILPRTKSNSQSLGITYVTLRVIYLQCNVTIALK